MTATLAGLDLDVDEVGGRTWRVVPARANGQAAFEFHLPDGLHALHVLTFRAGRIARITVFLRE
jgi:hypothetical protein